ncbi:MAG: hypothetical protein IJK28_07405 [Clostridia bacterium]|nr:hypothetical protein [Clostridia bacterium]
MHERIQRAILQYALSGKPPVLTPIEQEAYDRSRRQVLANPGVEFIIPTSYPDSGIELRYADTRGDGLTRDEVDKLSEKAEVIVDVIESAGLVCEDGLLTVAFDDMMCDQMEMKVVNHTHRLILPRLGCAVPGQLEEQLS